MREKKNLESCREHSEMSANLFLTDQPPLDDSPHIEDDPNLDDLIRDSPRRKELESKPTKDLDTIITKAEPECKKSKVESFFKRYTFYDGKSKLWCRGKFLTGPKPCAIFMTLTLTNLPMIIYYSFIIPRIENDLELSIVLCLSLLIHILYISFMWITATTNPGIIPKLELDPSILCRISMTRPKSVKFLVPFKGVMTKQAFCKTCLIIRPPRTYHCYYCDNCVEVFDHHCPWISCCIGKRNYPYFILFISNLTLMLLFSMIISIKTFAETDGDTGFVFKENIPNMIVIIYNFCVGFFPFCLTMYHYAIILRGETTHENLKCIYAKGLNPFKKGFCANIRMRLCRRKGANKMVQNFNMMELQKFKFTKEIVDLEHVRDEKSYYLRKDKNDPTKPCKIELKESRASSSVRDDTTAHVNKTTLKEIGGTKDDVSKSDLDISHERNITTPSQLTRSKQGDKYLKSSSKASLKTQKEKRSRDAKAMKTNNTTGNFKVLNPANDEMINPLFHPKLEYHSKPLKEKKLTEKAHKHQRSFSKNYIVEHLDNSLSSKVIGESKEIDGDDYKITRKRMKKQAKRMKGNQSNQLFKNNFLED